MRLGLPYGDDKNDKNPSDLARGTHADCGAGFDIVAAKRRAAERSNPRGDHRGRPGARPAPDRRADPCRRRAVARDFAPTWRTQAQIDSLLETIDESYKEGLDPRDYHVDRVRAAREAFANVDALPAAERAA